MKVVVAVTGCPAMLRVPEYAPRMRQDVSDVSIFTVASDSAKLFLASALMTNLSDVNLDAAEKYSVPWHSQLAEEDDLLETMPASAGRTRHYIFPSMNSMLWQSLLVQRNARTLQRVAVRLWKQTSNCIELSNRRVETGISLPSYEVWF